MKKNIFLVSALLCCSIALIFASYLLDRHSRPDGAPPVSDAVAHIEISMDDGDIYVVGSAVEEWIKWEADTAQLYNQYRLHGRVYSGRTVDIQWGVFDIPDGSFIRKQYLELSTEKDFQEAVRYDLRSGERSIELQNLMADTDYYFRIVLELENNRSCIEEGHFKTQWSPRLLELENLRNVRDIGGWKTTEGKSIRQGLLYRGCELDGATIEKYQITKRGKDILLNELKIKTELDLRASDQKGVQNMLGSSVEHRYFALPSYAGCFTADSNEKLREIFAALAVKENYPVYLHCTDGADRTGIVSYLLEALLGVPEEDCFREWELSALAFGGGEYEAMGRFIQKLQTMEGDTLQEKTETYLLSIGVTAAQLQSIRSILMAENV